MSWALPPLNGRDVSDVRDMNSRTGSPRRKNSVSFGGAGKQIPVKSMFHLFHTEGGNPSFVGWMQLRFAWRKTWPPPSPAAQGRRCHSALGSKPGSTSLGLTEVFTLESCKDPSQACMIFLDSKIWKTTRSSGPVTTAQCGWR